jgi:hypothetical protein
MLLSPSSSWKTEAEDFFKMFRSPIKIWKLELRCFLKWSCLHLQVGRERQKISSIYFEFTLSFERQK